MYNGMDVDFHKFLTSALDGSERLVWISVERAPNIR
jgi:hypothetical protein